MPGEGGDQVPAWRVAAPDGGHDVVRADDDPVGPEPGHHVGGDPMDVDGHVLIGRCREQCFDRGARAGEHDVIEAYEVEGRSVGFEPDVGEPATRDSSRLPGAGLSGGRPG